MTTTTALYYLRVSDQWRPCNHFAVLNPIKGLGKVSCSEFRARSIYCHKLDFKFIYSITSSFYLLPLFYAFTIECIAIIKCRCLQRAIKDYLLSCYLLVHFTSILKLNSKKVQFRWNPAMKITWFQTVEFKCKNKTTKLLILFLLLCSHLVMPDWVLFVVTVERERSRPRNDDDVMCPRTKGTVWHDVCTGLLKFTHFENALATNITHTH